MEPLTTRTKLCPHIDRNGRSCPQIAPCPVHPPRDRNASWSKDRDTTEQARFRKAVLERDGHKCTRCGSTWKLVAHHVKPGYDASCGITLCGRCHGIVDKNAR